MHLKHSKSSVPTQPVSKERSRGWWGKEKFCLIVQSNVPHFLSSDGVLVQQPRVSLIFIKWLYGILGPAKSSRMHMHIESFGVVTFIGTRKCGVRSDTYGTIKPCSIFGTCTDGFFTFSDWEVWWLLMPTEKVKSNQFCDMPHQGFYQKLSCPKQTTIYPLISLSKLLIHRPFSFLPRSSCHRCPRPYHP